MKIYLVGGAVRDQLLSHPFTEKDWVVVGATPKELLDKHFTMVGKDFPVFLHPKTKEEYALARTERKTAPGYKGFTVHASPEVSLEEDLARRDLTINAIAQADDGTIIDPFNGQDDITQRQLRHISPAFSEDPVRILRVARFLARYFHLGFSITQETLSLMQSMVHNGETQHLVAERVWQECEKALKEKHPECFFDTLARIRALQDVLGIQPDNHWDTSLSTLKQSTTHTQDSVIRLAIFCYFLEEAQINIFCQKLTLPNQYKDLIHLVRKHCINCTQTQWHEEHLATLFKQCDALRKPERFEQLLTACSILSGKDNLHTLLDALVAYRQVDVKALIEQGYEKAELGKALDQARLNALNIWLNNTMHTKGNENNL